MWNEPSKAGIAETETPSAISSAQRRSKLTLLGAAAGLAAGWLLAQGAVADASKPEVFRGWLRFHGEFQLYDSKDGLRHEASGNCISGALPLKKQRAAAKLFDGDYVVVYGERVPWVADRLTMALINKGSPITNRCGKGFIIFATRIVSRHR